MKNKHKGREERFTGIYAEYYPLVYNAVYSKIGKRHDADDICQEVFLISA
jgi:DNA-directed RNA polymerase specialized sigma24 family protein